MISRPPWRNRLARSAVNRKVGGSSPPGGGFFFVQEKYFLAKIITKQRLKIIAFKESSLKDYQIRMRLHIFNDY